MVVQQLVSSSDDTNTDSQEGLDSGEGSGEVKARIVVEARGLLVEVRGLEDVSYERQVHIDDPGGGGGESGDAHERHEVNVGVTFEELNGGAIRGCGLSSLGHSDSYVEYMSGGAAHWDELQLEFDELGIGVSLSYAGDDACGGGDNAAVDIARACSGEWTTRSPVK
jgi:hypothetical protein